MKLLHYFKTGSRLMSIFVQVWKILLNALAYFPILSLVSVLGIALPAFLLSLFFSEITLRYILEIIICLLLIGFYLKLLSKRSISKISLSIYWFISISTLILFFLTDFKFVIIFQFALILIYAFKYINRFNKFRDFLTKSTKALAFINVFDGIICGTLIYFLHNPNLVESTVSKKQINNWIAILLLLILPLILSVIKTVVSIKIFKKTNKVDISKGKTFWNVYATMIISSFFWLLSYLCYFFSRALKFHFDLLSDVFVLLFFIALYLFFWLQIYNMIGYGAKDIKEVIASWLIGTICILLLAVFNQVENELINALSWFLPILIPNLIGEINSQFDINKYKKKPIRTDKMDRHLYRIQIYGFLTLLMLSIIPKLIEIIWGLKIKVELAKLINSSSDWMSEFLASTIIIFFCFILSLIIGGGLIWLLKYFYLDPSKRYYKFEKNKRRFY
ncbi:beta-carotene 15,15'-monooxygenase [Streptococcus gordonii]|nr:beta-carotene 15,15'-monooxygenase [Streptococcus sp. SG2]MCB6407239.1 beta-carotene 15,15'-monooxygenase [Streptococcus gordonii]MCY7142164.1 beta-carotene 15,15'-monooxygenase [Streptococcus gordonii]MCY7148616.1 beta-carotene 15,15'-monooxygenase [Streptococcus gordonii]MCY7166788.1 beta-carotene 15,15'-monooxygenase [Streptococcus gordonii]MDN5021776.1 beta-carotene 15,15'-monooxygenase [Streptococcus sp. SG2]